MKAKELIGLFEVTTALKPGQTKVLAKIIIQYDTPEQLAYEAIGLLNEGVSYAKVKKDFTSQKFGWRGRPYREHRDSRKMRDDMLENPPEVREGEIECPDCGKTKTLVVEMQTRSADEGFTYAIHCFNKQCKRYKKSQR